jgi:galactokinase
VFSGLFGLGLSPLDIALAGKFAENVYFGKPCGLMDQAASSFGGCMMIDFNDPLAPIVSPVSADLTGYSMCVVAADDSHADLTANYAAIPDEMKKVAAYFGKDVLRDVPPGAFYKAIKDLRFFGDRPVLRAIHFFEDCGRVERQYQALQAGDTDTFLKLVKESGRSSLAYLQNIYNPADPGTQGIMLALALADRVLGDKGAFRVHGGGFAGTILAFVPDPMKDEFTSQLSAVFGEGCCLFLKIK